MRSASYGYDRGDLGVQCDCVGIRNFGLLDLTEHVFDHDGYEYKPGDIVWLASGTRHNSTTRNGCMLIVYLRDFADVAGA